MITKEIIQETEEGLGLREIIDAGLLILQENGFFQTLCEAVEAETLAQKQKSSEECGHD